MSLGRDATGLCRCSPCWRHPLGTTSSRDAGTRGSPTGQGRWSCSCAAGYPHRPLVLVGDNGYAVLDLLHCCQSLREPVTLIARLRLDAALYAPAPPRPVGSERPVCPERPPATVAENLARTGRCAVDRRRGGLVRTAPPAPSNSPLKPPSGTARASLPSPSAGCWYEIPRPPSIPRPSFAPTHRQTRPRSWNGLSCAGNSRSPFRKRSTHLGMETQRQWSDLAIARTTPGSAGSLLLDHSCRPFVAKTTSHDPRAPPPGTTKPSPTFVDAIALVRRHLWLASEDFSLSVGNPRHAGIPRRSVPPNGGLPRLRRLKCGKPSFVVGHLSRRSELGSVPENIDDDGVSPDARRFR